MAEIKQIFRLLSLHSKNAILIGSQAQKEIKYKNDYDINQQIIFNENKQQFITDVHKLFIRMARELKKNKNVYFIELKAGYYKPLYISDDDILDKAKRNSFYEMAKTNGQLPKEIYDMIKTIKNPKDLLKFCSNLYKVRWSLKDILNGFVVLFNGDKFNFSEIFDSKTIIKVDVLLFDTEEIRFIPFSNNFLFMNNDKEMSSDGVDDTIESSLKESIKELIQEDNYYKAIKRMYSLARLKNDKEQQAKLVKIINSEAGELYYIKSNIDNCIEVLGTYKAKKQQEEVKLVLENLQGSYDFPKRINNQFDKVHSKKSATSLMKSILKLSDEVNILAQKETLKEININKLKI